ncbi:MAG TPA: hypothetical protein VG327_15295 [Mycobacterium sp.]|nr:hypothetical protein [Mycobacterium sp.]
MPANRLRSAADILACRIEFARMLDGTHAREGEDGCDAEWAELLS